MTRTVLFLCPHNAAKSVLATAYFEKFANERGLDVRAISAGTEPDTEVWPSVIELLRTDGLEVTAQKPRHVTEEDLREASRIISMGCDVSELGKTEAQVESWNDVPLASQDLLAARDAIRTHALALVAELDAS